MKDEGKTMKEAQRWGGGLLGFTLYLLTVVKRCRSEVETEGTVSETVDAIVAPHSPHTNKHEL